MKQLSQKCVKKLNVFQLCTIIDSKVLDFLWVELFNGFVTVLDGFTTDHMASFGRIIMSDLVSGLAWKGLKGFVVEQEIWCSAWWADNGPPGKICSLGL